MENVGELYINGIKEKLVGYYAAWLPIERFKLGDVGVLDGNLFRRITSLADPALQISFKERPDDEPAPINYVSDSGAKLHFKAGGEVNPNLPNIPKAKVGIGVDFSQTGAFVINAPEVYAPSVENIRQVGANIISAYRAGIWEEDWAAIVEIIYAPVATYIISRSSGSKLEFSVEGDAKVGSIDFGNTSVEFELKSQMGDVFSSIKARDTTPFFRLARIKTTWYNDDVIVTHLKANKLGGKSMTARLTLPSPSSIEENPEIANSLYFDFIRDSDPQLMKA